MRLKWERAFRSLLRTKSAVLLAGCWAGTRILLANIRQGNEKMGSVAEVEMAADSILTNQLGLFCWQISSCSNKWKASSTLISLPHCCSEKMFLHRPN